MALLPQLVLHVGLQNPLAYTDPKGEEIVTGLISAAINIGLQTAINYEANGGNLTQALKCVNANSVLAAFVVGMVLPGAGATIGVTARFAVGAATSQQVADNVLGFALGGLTKLGIGQVLNGLNGPATYAPSCECNKNNTGIGAVIHEIVY